MAWDRLTGLEITEVEQNPEGEVTFPLIDSDEWIETVREPHDGYSFVSYRRRSAERVRCLSVSAWSPRSAGQVPSRIAALGRTR